MGVERSLELLSLFQRDFEHRRWLSASHYPDNLAVLVVDQASHHGGQTQDVAVAKRLELHDLMKVVFEQTFNEVHVESIAAAPNFYSATFPGFGVGILGLSLTRLWSRLLSGLLLLDFGLSFLVVT